MLEDDDLGARLLAAFDDSFASFVTTLDCFAAYLDPGVAPPEHVDALAAWLGADASEGGLDGRRDEVRAAVAAHATRGTAAGLAARVRRLTGVDPQVCEGGAVAWSSTPGSPLPPSTRRDVQVRVPVSLDGPATERLAAEVRAAVPAHLHVELQVEEP
jgi:phage tail-like protein